MKPAVIAHRGASGYAPENTMAAFRYAFQMKADAIELDVRQTLNNEIVVIHDATLHRTTNGRGQVCARRLEELRRLDAGSWFGAHQKFRGERIPTLQEVAQWARGRIRMWIEIKAAEPDRVEKIIQQEKMSREVVLFSANIRTMEAIVQSSIERSLVVAGFRRDIPNATSLISLAQKLNLQSIAVHFSMITQQLIAQAHAHHLKVAVWTANRRPTIKRLVRETVDAIITNFPDRAREILVEK